MNEIATYRGWLWRRCTDFGEDNIVMLGVGLLLRAFGVASHLMKTCVSQSGEDEDAARREEEKRDESTANGRHQLHLNAAAIADHSIAQNPARSAFQLLFASPAPVLNVRRSTRAPIAGRNFWEVKISFERVS